MPEGDPWASSMPTTRFTPTATDMDFEGYGLLVSSLYGEDGGGELIAVGPDLTPRRVLAAMTAYARTSLSWAGYDAVADYRERIAGRELVIAIAPTVFTHEPGGGWDVHRRADGEPAAWLVSPWHPAHTFLPTEEHVMDPLVARFREIADHIEIRKDNRWAERAAYYRGRADHIQRRGRTDAGLTETTDY